MNNVEKSKFISKLSESVNTENLRGKQGQCPSPARDSSRVPLSARSQDGRLTLGANVICRKTTWSLSKATSVPGNQESPHCKHRTWWASAAQTSIEQELHPIHPEKRISYKTETDLPQIVKVVSLVLPHQPGLQHRQQLGELVPGPSPAAYLGISCHDQRPGRGGLRSATRHGQGGGQAGRQRGRRLEAELAHAGRRAGGRVRILGGQEDGYTRGPCPSHRWEWPRVSPQGPGMQAAPVCPGLPRVMSKLKKNVKEMQKRRPDCKVSSPSKWVRHDPRQPRCAGPPSRGATCPPPEALGTAGTAGCARGVASGTQSKR